MKFTSVEQIQEEFDKRLKGKMTIPQHDSVRREDIAVHEEALTQLMENSAYNELHGFTFDQLVNVVSSLTSNTPASYSKSAQIMEDFSGTTQAMAPTPIVNQGLVMYQYGASVLPYLAHMFDMKGSNRAFAYYMNIKANKTIGSEVTKGDLLASPKELGKQTLDYIGTKVTSKTIGNLVPGQVEYSLNLGFAPVAPQTLVIEIAGVTGYFQDFTTSTTSGTAYLTSVGGELGSATADLVNGTVEITLKDTPATTDAITATYNRDVQTEDAIDTNMAEIVMDIEEVALRAEDFSVRTLSNIQQSNLYQNIFGGNWDDEVSNSLGYMYNREIANRLVRDIKLDVPSASIFTHDVASVTETGDNRLFNAKFINYPIDKLAKQITRASGLPVTKCASLVVNQDVLPILRGHDKFQEFEGSDSEDGMGGMYLLGTFNKVPVVATPNDAVLASGEVLGLHKSKKQAFLAPAVFGSFILPTIRSVFDKDNLSIQRKQLISSAAVKVVAENLSAKLLLDNIDDII